MQNDCPKLAVVQVTYTKYRNFAQKLLRSDTNLFFEIFTREIELMAVPLFLYSAFCGHFKIQEKYQILISYRIKHLPSFLLSFITWSIQPRLKYQANQQSKLCSSSRKKNQKSHEAWFTVLHHISTWLQPALSDCFTAKYKLIPPHHIYCREHKNESTADQHCQTRK